MKSCSDCIWPCCFSQGNTGVGQWMPLIQGEWQEFREKAGTSDLELSTTWLWAFRGSSISTGTTVNLLERHVDLESFLLLPLWASPSSKGCTAPQPWIHFSGRLCRMWYKFSGEWSNSCSVGVCVNLCFVWLWCMFRLCPSSFPSPAQP